MIAAVAHDDDAFRLVDTNGREVGWIRSSAIRFGGFDTPDDARAAALDGAHALATCLKREFGVAHLELSGRPRARSVRDGSNEWIVDGRLRVARLLRTETERGHKREFAIEFLLPRFATNAVALNAARAVYGVLRPDPARTPDPLALDPSDTSSP